MMMYILTMNNKGVTLVELLIVIVIIGIITGFGIPEYGRFAAKSSTRKAATELMQNMRMARTMAIKENRTYLITLDPSTNTYSIGFDTNDNSSLADAVDVYGQGPVRVVDAQSEYGNNVVLDSSNFAVNPPNGPGGVTISSQSSFRFLPDSSSDPTGMVYFQHTGRGYTYCVELANTAGKLNLFLWQGDEDNTSETGWTELR